jgi:hypothetical protein
MFLMSLNPISAQRPGARRPAPPKNEQNYCRGLADKDPYYDVPGEARARIELLQDELADGQKYRIIQP